MKYFVSYQYPHRSIIDFELIIENITEDFIEIELPNWRPGRYQIQNFAKNIRNFEVLNIENQLLNFQKITKSTWKIDTKNQSQIRIKYEYFARQVDAGGSWLTDNLLYINWITCGFYLKNRKNENYEIELQLPENYQIATGLKTENHTLFASDFDELVDSPLMASPNLKHETYQCEGFDTIFHLWFEGNLQPNWEKIKTDFQKFSDTQLALFQDFPSSDYHFMFLILPFRNYHGVEHRNSTMIVMGADSDFENFYQADVLGISSHELFHFWNAIRIRPAELSPYDYRQENYFETGFVIEGITTYYGDYLLFRSGVWSENEYLFELNKTLKRHFDNYGRFYKSVAESSVDLWLDGYELGIPNRKTSIYIKGAISALILDLEIRKITQNQKSLDDLMRFLWQNYGKSQVGYSVQNYKDAVKAVSGNDFESYFEDYIFGIKPIENQLNNSLNWIGCELEKTPANFWYEQILGFQTLPKNGTIFRVASDSPADFGLTVGDEILTINGISFDKIGELSPEKNTEFVLEITRMKQQKTVILKSNGKKYFEQFKVQKLENCSEIQAQSFENWAK